MRQRYHERFAEAKLPVPVEAIPEDLLGLRVAESDDLEVSGMLLPARREIWLNGREAEESPGRRRFTLDRKSTRLNSSHIQKSRMPSSA